MKKNPFTPTFGCIPTAMAGRDNLIQDILEGLSNAPGDPNRTSIFVGGRGTGKTALLALVAERAEEQGWISVNVTSGPDMLEEILVQIREKATHLLTPETTRMLSSLQIGGIGFTVESKERKSTWRSEMTSIIKELNDSEAGLLITVDEVSPKHEALKLLVVAMQHFIRERRDVAMLLAGLPSSISLLLRDEQITFLRRAFQHTLSAIDINEVAYAMRQTVEAGGRSINDDALLLAAEGSRGFAFLIQLIGYHMWRQHPEEHQISKEDVQGALSFAMRDMERMIFDAVMMELSSREREYLVAMSLDEDASEVINIADRMGVDPNNAAHVRRRLIQQGVIGERGRGRVALEIPMLAEYLRKSI